MDSWIFCFNFLRIPEYYFCFLFSPSRKRHWQIEERERAVVRRKGYEDVDNDTDIKKRQKHEFPSEVVGEGSAHDARH